MRRREPPQPEGAALVGRGAMPGLPRPQRLSLHDAINYVAERCNCETEKAGKAVHAALGEGTLRLDAHLLVREGHARVDAGIGPVPSKVWAGYPWPDFFRRAVHPHGNQMYNERTADGRWVGPVYSAPTVLTTDIDLWLDSDDSRKGLADAVTAGKEKGIWETLYEAVQLKPGAFGLAIDLKPIFERVRRYLGFR
jgi:hypothetical protein